MHRRQKDEVTTKPIQRQVIGNPILRLLPVGERLKTWKSHAAQSKPFADYFESESFNKSDVIIKQKQRHLEIEDRERNKPTPKQPERIDYNFDVDWFSGYTFKFPSPISMKPGCHQAIRRPLALGFGMQSVAEINEWSDKPFSTLDLDYKKNFPLLLKRVSEAEEKDLVFVKTETRRQSVVTTDYMTGSICLSNNSGKETKYHIFPVFYEEPESSSSGSDIEYPSYHYDAGSKSELQEESASKSELPTESLTSGAADISSSESSLEDEPAPAGWPTGWNPKARRLSIAGPPKLKKSIEPRVVRRKSIDYGGVPFTFRRPPVMETLEEGSSGGDGGNDDDDDDDEEPRIKKEDVINLFCHQDKEFDIKHAEETMEHLDHNLETLENFLKGYSSVSTTSETSLHSGATNESDNDNELHEN